MAEEHNATLDAILRRRRRRTLLRALGVGIALVACGIFLWLRGLDERTEPMPLPSPPLAEVERAPTPSPLAPDSGSAEEPASAAAEPRPLPSLDESDPLVREMAARLSSRPEVLVWLASDELIRRIVAGVDAIAKGESPVDQIPTSMRPQGRFEVVSSGSGQIAAPSAHARYDVVTEVVSGLDGEGLVRAYRELQPLLEVAYRDLGHPSGSFDAALRDAIFELLSAPTVPGQPLLEPLTLGHAYADPSLEDLSAAQKQLLRFGPGNALRIRQKIQEVALRLGIPESELPKSTTYSAPTQP